MALGSVSVIGFSARFPLFTMGLTVLSEEPLISLIELRSAVISGEIFGGEVSSKGAEVVVSSKLIRGVCCSGGIASTGASTSMVVAEEVLVRFGGCWELVATGF